MFANRINKLTSYMNPMQIAIALELDKLKQKSYVQPIVLPKVKVLNKGKKILFLFLFILFIFLLDFFF